MRKAWYVGVAMALLAVGLSTALAESEIKLDYMSAYVWRGLVANCAAVVQPSIDVATPWGLSLNAWGNMDATKKNDLGGKFNEVDLTADYALPIQGPVGVNFGIINYLFPYHDEQMKVKGMTEDGDLIVDGETIDVANPTTEIYGSVDMDVTLATDVTLVPKLLVVRDVEEAKGWYSNLGVSTAVPVADKLTAGGEVSVGWGDKKYNEYYTATEKSEFNDVNVKVTLAYNFTEQVSVGAMGAYTSMIGSEVKDNAKALYGYKDIFYTGLNLAYAF